MDNEKDKDPFDELFGVEPKEEEVPDETQPVVLPDDKKFGAFAGKPLDSLVEAYQKLEVAHTQKSQDLAELVKKLEKGDPPPDPRPNEPAPDPEKELLWSIALELKLDKLAVNNPVVADHRDEIVEILTAAVDNPSTRTMDKVIGEAIKYVKGNHFDEYVKKAAPVMIENDAAGNPKPPTKDGMTLTEQQKLNLAGFYGDDLKAAKVAIFGEED